jgi:hypothetical protein
MSMLKPATNKQAFAKVGIYGNAGSGKTYTAALIAIGLHKYANATKPVGMFDTEPAASYIIPLFEKAGIPFLVYDESRALKDLMAFMDEAERECFAVIIDSVTHVWRDTQESYIAKVNEGLAKKGKRPIFKLEFHHWGPIKAAWAKFTDRYLSSKLHVIVCGRAGSIYEYQENQETGKKELITTGTRMATEKEMGYEPSLLIEMAPAREEGKTINRAVVVKDRTDTLNGHEIDFPDFEKLKPHFAFLNLGGAHYDSMEKRDSKEMFTEDGQDDWSNEQRQRGIWSEEIAGLMQKHHPSQTADDKKARADLMDEIFHTRSWKKIEEATPSKDLRAGYARLKAKLEPEEPELPDVDEIIEQIKESPDAEIAALALDTARGHPDEKRAQAVFNEVWLEKAA